MRAASSCSARAWQTRRNAFPAPREPASWCQQRRAMVRQPGARPCVSIRTRRQPHRRRHRSRRRYRIISRHRPNLPRRMSHHMSRRQWIRRPRSSLIQSVEIAARFRPRSERIARTREGSSALSRYCCCGCWRGTSGSSGWPGEYPGSAGKVCVIVPRVCDIAPSRCNCDIAPTV